MIAPDTLWSVLWIGIILMNVIGFAAMGLDKRRARRHSRRISEARLLAIAVLGGSIGSITGMFAFHHKTRHIKFRAGLPAIIILQAAAFVLFAAWRSGNC